MSPGFAKLDDTNYAEWRMFMEAQLMKQGVLTVATGETTRPPGADTANAVKAWKKKNQIALSEIILGLTPSQLGHVRGIADAHPAWTALETVHRSRGLGTRLSLRRDFYTMAKRDDQPMTSWISDVNKAAFQLKDIGAEVSDEDIMVVLTIGLPSSYENFLVSLDATPTDDLTLEYVIRRLVNEDSRQAQSLPASSSPTAYAATTRFQRPGPSAPATQLGQPRGKVPLSEITCFNCGAKGHYQQKCPLPLKPFRDRAALAVATTAAITGLNPSSKDLDFSELAF
ncbi:transcription factor [Ganoderma sinense ZZ0214-1]|uniref:Transcription factor n=1 Tax=Ganoderma sinense ZZ0214-1 TaxID=1077348 RepID=A0A2G8S6Z6_9APHY|nr:transcription factor [Ganoderma sinense ZZ0214-1]